MYQKLFKDYDLEQEQQNTGIFCPVFGSQSVVSKKKRSENPTNDRGPNTESLRCGDQKGYHTSSSIYSLFVHMQYKKVFRVFGLHCSDITLSILH